MFEGKTDRIDRLIYLGMPLEHETVEGGTPLHIAIECQNPHATRLLLGAGANPNRRSHGIQPLFTAIKNKSPEIVKALLDNGANVNIKGESKQNVIHYLVSSVHIDAPDHEVDSARRIYETLMQNGANHNEQDYLGNTPLHRGMHSGSAVCEILIHSKSKPPIDLTIKNDAGVPVYKLAEHIVSRIENVEDEEAWERSRNAYPWITDERAPHFLNVLRGIHHAVQTKKIKSALKESKDKEINQPRGMEL
jgi:ankyrin repeat protein